MGTARVKKSHLKSYAASIYAHLKKMDKLYRLYRPYSAEDFLNCPPRGKKKLTTKKIAPLAFYCFSYKV